jgi:plastocyanin
MKRLIVVMACGNAAILAAGCGGGGHAAQPASTQSASTQVQAQATQAQSSPAVHGQPISGALPCKPHGRAITITATHLTFSTKCLAAPANAPFTITFANHDVPAPAVYPHHNVGVYGEPAFEHEIFGGAVVGPEVTVTYHVGALPRGIYFFKCDLHPFMQGTLVVD